MSKKKKTKEMAVQGVPMEKEMRCPECGLKLENNKCQHCDLRRYQ